MKWKMSGTWPVTDGAAWVGVDDASKITGSPVPFLEAVQDELKEDRAVLITPTGPAHEITGPMDQRGAFLLGQAMLEDRTVTGDPPVFEIPPIPEDAVS